MSSLLVVFISIILVGFIFELSLEVLNLRNRNKPVPHEIADVYEPERYLLQQKYEVETTRFSLIGSSLSLLLTIAVLYFGLFGYLHGLLASHNFSNVIITLYFFGIVALIAKVISLPFSIYSIFIIEEKYGFNRTTARLFVTDTLKSLLLGVTIGGGLLALITWVFYLSPQWFWIIALAVMLIFSLLANALYSRIIVPLFNKQTPLEEGELFDKIKEFATKVNFPISKVFVIDGSKRSTKANAYFSGFSKNRRVVLYDTLIQKMTHDEIIAVLAHEIGHYRKKHIWINMALGTLQMSLFLYIFNLLSTSPRLPEALGFENVTEPIFHLAIIGFAILYSPVENLIGLFTNYLSRRMEYQADRYAAKHNLAEPLISGLKKLSAENFSNLTPHPAYVFVNYSHPTLLQRLLKLRQAIRK